MTSIRRPALVLLMALAAVVPLAARAAERPGSPTGSPNATAPGLAVTSSIADGATLSGSVVWTATATGLVTKLDFVIDGAVRWTERLSPYQFNGDPNGRLDTTQLSNGTHVLAVKAYGTGDGSASATSTVTIANAKPSSPPSPTGAIPAPSGTPQVGSTLTAATGSWSGTQPISYSFQWKRCDSGGGSCQDLSGATGSTYTLVTADAGATIRVRVKATNSAGQAWADSAPTGVVQAAPSGGGGSGGASTFGTTTPGTKTDFASANLKEVSRYSAPQAGLVAKLTGYISGLGATSGSQPVRAVVYADASGNPGSLLGVSNAVTVTAGQPWGWVDFVFPSAVSIPAGTLWMGYIAGSRNDLTELRYDASVNELRYNVNPGGYAAGPSSPFGQPTYSSKHYSLYGTYASTSTSPPPPPAPPQSTSPPTITGTVQVGQTLTTSDGTWSGATPMTYTYAWQRCDASGASCAGIAGASGSTYTLADPDAGSTIRAVVTASNSAGSASATSSATAVVQSAPASSPPPTGAIPRFGVSLGGKSLFRSPADRRAELDQIKAMVGGQPAVVRIDSTPGNQPYLDPWVADATARGLVPMLILFGTTGPVSPTSAAAFAAAQGAKWKGTIRLYEFCNEPDLNGWTPEQYTASLKAVYTALKQADPNAILVAGALWKWDAGPTPNPSGGVREWVQRMYAAGAKGYFDMLSLHLYDDPDAHGSWNLWDQAFTMSPSVRSIMDSNGDQSIPIISTESGAPVTKYGESGQAQIIGDGFNHLYAGQIGMYLVYTMENDDVSGFGLLRDDGSRRPAWYTFQQRVS